MNLISVAVTGFTKLMEDAGLPTFVGDMNQDNIVAFYWMAVAQLADRVEISQQGTYFTIEDGGITSENINAIQTLIGWALCRIGGSQSVAPAKTNLSQSENAQTVREIVDDFVNDDRTFSAHDVTVVLRSKVNNDLADWESDRTLNVRGKDIPVVSHNEVRELVHEYMEVFTAAGSYEQVDNGMYQTYRPL